MATSFCLYIQSSLHHKFVCYTCFFLVHTITLHSSSVRHPFIMHVFRSSSMHYPSAAVHHPVNAVTSPTYRYALTIRLPSMLFPPAVQTSRTVVDELIDELAQQLRSQSLPDSGGLSQPAKPPEANCPANQAICCKWLGGGEHSRVGGGLPSRRQGGGGW